MDRQHQWVQQYMILKNQGAAATITKKELTPMTISMSMHIKSMTTRLNTITTMGKQLRSMTTIMVIVMDLEDIATQDIIMRI